MNKTTNPTRFTCHITAKPIADGVRVTITSPKTGRVLEVTASRLPTELRGRIVQAVGNGKHEAAFTAEELRTITSLGVILMPAKPAPPLVIPRLSSHPSLHGAGAKFF